MATRSSAVSTKQPKVITIDPDAFKASLEQYQGDLDEVKSAPIMIYSDDTFTEAVSWYQRAKDLETKFNDAFKPVSESLKLAEKSLKGAVSVFTGPLSDFQASVRKQCEEYLRLNPEAEPESGRITKGKWKMEVSDEDTLLRSGIIATNKKDPETGKMYIDIQFDPKIRSLFVYNEAKGNALAGIITTTLSIPGTTIKQSSHLTLTGEK